MLFSNLDGDTLNSSDPSTPSDPSSFVGYRPTSNQKISTALLLHAGLNNFDIGLIEVNLRIMFCAN